MMTNLPKWLQKSIVVLVTVMTFGLVTPTGWFDEVHSLDEKLPKRDIHEPKINDQEESVTHLTVSEETNLTEDEQYFHQLMSEVKTQSFEKFGSKIKPVIKDEFVEVILPKIERAIAEVSMREDESFRQLEIIEGSSGGESERIFHLGDMLSKEEIIRFHVRRDHPPQAGYWFNFHYHTYHDGFQEHYELGNIYWDKNTPPNWMT